MPRICSVPPYEVSSGPEVVELCRRAGLILDPWQRLVLQHGLGEQADGRWSAFEVAVEVARQNGKGEVLMALEVGCLFLLDVQLILHTAHEFKTSSEAFRRVVSLIENCDMLRKQVKTVRRTTGEEGIELMNGNRLRFLARSTSSGRGFSADLIIWDEAQVLDDGPVQAMLPTLSARPNPQLWYAGTAGNERSIHLAAVRRRGLKGDDPTLAYMEWSVDEDDYDPGDVNDWAKANPAMPHRITEEYITRERAAMSAEGFARERLGKGDWPVDGENGVISAAAWQLAADVDGEQPAGLVVFAVDVNPERTAGAICVAGSRPDGRRAVEVVDQRTGLDWIVPRLVELVDQYVPLGVVVDVGGPAGTLHGRLETLNVELVVPSSQEVAQAAEGFYDAVMDGTLAHLDDQRLNAAVQGAKKRPIGEAWGWGRRQSTTDISPLVAGSLALWGLSKLEAMAVQPTAAWI